MGRVVRAGIDATGLLVFGAEVAGGGLLLDHGLLPPRLVGVFGHNGERMQVYVAVGAVFRAQAASDAPVLDDHLERMAAADRAHRTANHAQRVAALTARSGYQVFLEA